MGALASIASVVGAGASIFGNVRQAEQQNAVNQAQAQVAQQQEAAREQSLVAQQQAAQEQRQLTLEKTIAATRAQLASGGVTPDDGSSAAIEGGLTEQTAMADQADQQQLAAQLGQRRISLLNPDQTGTALLQSGRTFGFASRSLLD